MAHDYGWRVEEVTAPDDQHARFVALGIDADGEVLSRPVVLPQPWGWMQAAGLRSRAVQVKEPEASAWLAVADMLDRRLAEASHDRKETP